MSCWHSHLSRRTIFEYFKKMPGDLQSLTNDNIYKIHAPQIQGCVFREKTHLRQDHIYVLKSSPPCFPRPPPCSPRGPSQRAPSQRAPLPEGPSENPLPEAPPARSSTPSSSAPPSSSSAHSAASQPLGGPAALAVSHAEANCASYCVVLRRPRSAPFASPQPLVELSLVSYL